MHAFRRDDGRSSWLALLLRESWLPTLLAILLLLLLAFFYAGALDDYFYRDDFVFLERSRIRSPADLLRFFSAELNHHHAYRPVSTNFYFGTMQALFGPDPFCFHLANLAVLAANSVLVFWALSSLGVARAVSAASAIVYATTPVNFASQLWISVIQDLTATFFSLLCFLSYVAADGARRRPLRHVSLGLFVLALLSKEIAICLPLVLLVYEVIVRRQASIQAARAVIPFVALAAAAALSRWIAFGFPSRGPYRIDVGSFVLSKLTFYTETAGDALLLSSRGWVLLLALVGSAAAFAVADARHRRLCLFGALWFLLMISPLLFFPDRGRDFYLILPIVGALIAAASLLDAVVGLVPGRRIAPAALALLAAGFCWAARERFDEIDAGRRGWTSSFGSVVEQVRATYPQVPDGTRFFFLFPEGYPGSRLLHRSGAVFRVVYDNPTLQGFAVTEEELPEVWKQGRAWDLVFELTRGDRLVPRRPGTSPQP